MTQDLDGRLRNKPKTRAKRSNLTKDELNGLQWLENMINLDKLNVVQADKGGAILLINPELLKKKTEEKLQNKDLYTELPHDPTHELHEKLYMKWVEGKTSEFISEDETKNIMGISNSKKKDGSGPTNHPITLPHYKPGRAYFYPSMKIHKVKKEDLIPGIEPPIRLITGLQDGVSKRSDVFLAENFLSSLQQDFCSDLLLDTTDALKWLEKMDNNTKPNTSSFTFDFKSLYDSLSQKFVIDSLKEAMHECRPEWTQEFRNWFVDLFVLVQNHQLVNLQ